MTVGIKRQLFKVRNEVENEIHSIAMGSPVAAGLAREGYAGGYVDAINDVLLVLDGVPVRRRNWWVYDDHVRRES